MTLKKHDTSTKEEKLTQGSPALNWKRVSGRRMAKRTMEKRGLPRRKKRGVPVC